MDERPSTINVEKFILEVSKLEPIEFFGLTKVFNIELVEDDDKKTPRKFEEVLSEILDKYIRLSRKQRRTITKMVKSANLGKIKA